MNITQATAALRKLYGKSACYRYDDKAPKADEREAINASLPALRDARDAAREAMEKRRAELLADPEYLRLREAWKLADKAAHSAIALSGHYRVTVGRSTGLFFTVEAEGDNWQDAIDKARAKAVRS